uniref:Transmembrane protein n=1 Tax=Ascaris lumbricoides TaxID=6252 RepID=A0A0M3I535_ASCLU
MFVDGELAVLLLSITSSCVAEKCSSVAISFLKTFSRSGLDRDGIRENEDQWQQRFNHLNTVTSYWPTEAMETGIDNASVLPIHSMIETNTSLLLAVYAMNSLLLTTVENQFHGLRSTTETAIITSTSAEILKQHTTSRDRTSSLISPQQQTNNANEDNKAIRKDEVISYVVLLAVSMTGTLSSAIIFSLTFFGCIFKPLKSV